MGFFDYFKRKRNWANLDGYNDRPTSSGISVNESTALSIPAVYACIRVLAESIASLPLITYEKLSNDDRERATGFSLYRLLHDAPNPLMTSFEFRENMVGHLCLRGNFYAYIEREDGEVVALWPLHPDRVKVEAVGRELVYTHQPENGPEKKYRMEDILHIRGLSSDGIIGYSPLTLLRDTIGHAKSVSDYSAKFFQNSAKPGGIISHPGRLSKEAHENFLNSWHKSFQGVGNAQRTALLEEGLTWQTISISPEESQMIESAKFSVIEIARCFRIPLNLLMDYDRSTYSNVTEQNRSFLIHTLMPWLTKIEQALNRSLLTEGERSRFYVEHLTSGLLKADTLTRYQAYEIALRAGFLEKDEVRKLENLNSKTS